jgi:nicotinamidase-related amidase
MPERPIDSPETLPHWVLPWPSFEIDWDKAALMIIDYQNYSSNPSCGLEKMIIDQFPEIARYYVPRLSDVTIPNTQHLLEAFRRAGRQVIYLRNGPWLASGRDLIPRRQRREDEARDLFGTRHLWSRGTFEHEIIEALAPLPDELIVDKNSSSPFNSTGIDQILHNMGINRLILAGMATDMCVENTARDASDRGYNVVVVEDAVTTFFPEHHRAALSALARTYTQVWDTGRVLASLASLETREADPLD